MKKLDLKSELASLYSPAAGQDMKSFTAMDKSKWKWTAMIAQPACADEATLHAAMEDVRRKKKLAAIDRIRIEDFAEGRCAQTMHIAT